MSERRKVGSVSYREVGQDYFDQRGLKRHAGVFALWSLGVAAVISGDFFGWNFGLGVGGFGGLLLATVVITVMYYGLCYSIAEMSPALPHTGGAYSFARSAMGPWGGFITGLAENMEYVITPAVVVVSIGAYMGVIMTELFDLDHHAHLEHAPVLVGRVLPGVRWSEHRGHRGHDAIHDHHQHPRAPDPRLLLRDRDPASSTPTSCSTSRRAEVNRSRTEVDRSCRSGSRGSSRRCRSRSGSTSRSRSSRWPRRNRWTRHETSPRPRSGG